MTDFHSGFKGGAALHGRARLFVLPKQVNFLGETRAVSLKNAFSKLAEQHFHGDQNDG